ncbi:hypothetical protein AB0L59_30225 [Streptomyces sp. NPDC052109]|uniref:hypothetical protein n=1 Tax=Streptomyces sp. NPDC052109 TaxID=3155527 RepID=UPI00341D31BC
MNGYGLVAVVVASVAVVAVAVLWAVVKLAQHQQSAAGGAGMELVDGEALTASQAGRGGSDVRRRVAEAAERSRRGQDCE